MIVEQTHDFDNELIQACISGDIATAKSALEFADINSSDADGWTALHIAIHAQNQELTKVLLNHSDIDVNAQNKWRSTPLMLAANSGNLNIVECLLRHPMIRVNSQADYYGRTALIEASVKGHAHIARCLVSFGADVNLSDKTGRNTALIEAIKNNHLDVAIYLLRTGTIDFSNRDQRLQCLIWASRRGEKLRIEVDNAISNYFNRVNIH
ncbi:MAG: ankyrin repeat domain-containing protein [Aestuariivita sp.]|nr:ankyrin repeat domain-containing protein [Aestuariivita sp.]